MSLLKANSVQIGQSATATNNFTLAVPSSPDGTIKLARGNSGATTADILSVASTGRVTMATPPILGTPVVQLLLSTAQTISVTTYTKVLYDTVVADTDSIFNTSTKVIQPTIAGWYFISASIGFGATTSLNQIVIRILKNGGSNVWYTSKVGGLSNGDCFNVSQLVYFDGVSEYAQIDGYISGSGTLQHRGGGQETWMLAYLVART